MVNIFDTNILIDYLNGVEASILEIEDCDSKAISIITWMEVLVGVSEHEQGLIKDFLSNFKIINIDENIGQIAVSVRQKYKIRLPDAVILATAIYTDGILVTRNTKDFANIKSHIKIPYSL